MLNKTNGRHDDNKGEFHSRPISAFIDILALSQSETVNREIFKQTQAVTFELRCKWIFNIFSRNQYMMFKKDFSQDSP
jgi:hypothetical protein